LSDNEDRDAVDVGDSVTFNTEITDHNVSSVVEASGDTNLHHLENESAAEARFDSGIARGMLVGGLISAALAGFPSTGVYLFKDFGFEGSVRIGDRATDEVEIVDTLEGEIRRASGLRRKSSSTRK